MYKILLVEDDKAMAKEMQKQLMSWGYAVDMIHDFHDVMQEYHVFEPHLVLLDIMLPFFNGYHWCSEIRKVSNVPIIFISSAADNMNIVMAMNMGGDDFITKPFDSNVLIAKLQAMLRRTYDLTEHTPILEHQGAVLNIHDMTLLYQTQKVELTRNEFRMLQTLMENKGKVVSRETLMIRLWEIDCYVEENTLSVNIARLRKKLEYAGLHDFITTKIGVGYLIEK